MKQRPDPAWSRERTTDMARQIQTKGPAFVVTPMSRCKLGALVSVSVILRSDPAGEISMQMCGETQHQNNNAVNLCIRVCFRFSLLARNIVPAGLIPISCRDL